MLSLLSAIYGKIANLRNAFYDRGVFETSDLRARTISIGNISVGGTGKTPLVAYVAEILAARGETVCILTRGYGRKEPKKRVLVSDGEQILADPAIAGDEPFELAQKLIGRAIVIADADRVAAAEWAKRKFGVTAFVLDDGFQHRKAKRDVDIVCIDAMDPFGGGNMLPAGRLREPVENLQRADIIVITRANLVADQAISDLRSEISGLNPAAAVFSAKSKLSVMYDLENFIANIERSQNGPPLERAVYDMDVSETLENPVFVFCAIGNAENFFWQLRREDLDLKGTEAFRDHHVYTQQDIERIEELAKKSGASLLVTTTKDAVKLTGLKFTLWCVVVRSEVVIDNADAFAAML